MEEKAPVLSESNPGESGTGLEESVPTEISPAPNKNTRNFVIGCVIGAVLNCPLAFAFFLGVEENPRELLSPDWFRLLAPSFIVLISLLALAFTGKKSFWRVGAGFAAVFLVVLLLTVNWALTNHPIPTQAEMCIAIKEFSAAVEEGEFIQASTPAEQARAWRIKMADVWNENRDTILFIKYPGPDYLDMALEEHRALESRQTVGFLATTIQSKIRKIQSNLQPYTIEACTGQ